MELLHNGTSNALIYKRERKIANVLVRHLGYRGTSPAPTGTSCDKAVLAFDGLVLNGKELLKTKDWFIRGWGCRNETLR